MGGNHSGAVGSGSKVFAKVFVKGEHIANLTKEELVPDFVDDPAFDVEVMR